MTDSEKPRITKEFLKKILRSDFKHYYTTPALNDILYLHYKGFEKIENLEEFTGLKVLYLEGNGLEKIEGLDALKEMRTLYLQENLIKKIENLEQLTELRSLNLSDNMIEKIEGLSKNTQLQTLLLKRNRIGTNGLDDVRGVLEIPSLQVLDIQDNRIDDENILPEIFEKMPNLLVLYTQNNPFCKKIQSYRKTMIARLPKLQYLDDRPVFPEDRRFAEAWYRGGLEAEREERAKFKKEEEEKHIQNHLAFRAMIEGFRRQKEEEDAKREEESKQNAAQRRDSDQLNISIDSERSNSDAQTNESSISTSKLSTYNSETPETPDSLKKIKFNELRSSTSSKAESEATQSKGNSQVHSEAESEGEGENEAKSQSSTNFDELE